MARVLIFGILIHGGSSTEKIKRTYEIRRLEDGDDDSMNPRRKRERDWKHFPTGSA